MPKFQVRQINLTDAEYDAVNASTNPYAIPKFAAMIKSQFGDAAPGLLGGFYETVAEIEAEDLEHVFEISNLCDEGDNESRITRLARMHSLSVGDLVIDPEGRTHVVARFGFEEVAA